MPGVFYRTNTDEKNTNILDRESIPYIAKGFLKFKYPKFNQDGSLAEFKEDKSLAYGEIYSHSRGHFTAYIKVNETCLHNDSATHKIFKRKGDEDGYKAMILSHLKDKMLDETITGWQERSYFETSSSQDCSWCSASFLIYALSWVNQEKDINLLPAPNTNIWRRDGKRATGFLALAFYSNCHYLYNPSEKLDMNIDKAGFLISSNEKEQKILFNNLCKENGVKSQLLMPKILELLNDIHKKIKKFLEKIAYQNVLMYLLTHQLEELCHFLESSLASQFTQDFIIKMIGKTASPLITEQQYESIASELLSPLPYLQDKRLDKLSYDPETKKISLHCSTEDKKGSAKESSLVFSFKTSAYNSDVRIKQAVQSLLSSSSQRELFNYLIGRSLKETISDHLKTACSGLFKIPAGIKSLNQTLGHREALNEKEGIASRDGELSRLIATLRGPAT